MHIIDNFQNKDEKQKKEDYIKDIETTHRPKHANSLRFPTDRYTIDRSQHVDQFGNPKNYHMSSHLIEAFTVMLKQGLVIETVDFSIILKEGNLVFNNKYFKLEHKVVSND